MIRSAFVLVGVAAALTFVPSAEARPFPDCPPSGPLHSGRLQHDGITCAKARRLIRGFMGGSQTQGTHFKVDGFTCHNVAEGIGPGVICRRGLKRARFLGLPDFAALSSLLEPPSHRPAVRKGIAREMLIHNLSRTLSWRHRRSGYIDCDGGRVNRSEWRCHIRWTTPKYFSWCGKGRVTGAWHNPNEHQRPWYRVGWHAEPCYHGL